jgi:hypothetical protein
METVMDASQLEHGLLELENLLDRAIVLGSEIWFETFAFLLERLIAILRLLSGRIVGLLRRVLPVADGDIALA